jgi:hypothetical protein
MTNVLKASLALAVLLVGCTNRSREATATTTPSSGSTGASGQDASRRDKALVRFIQAIPSNDRVDLMFGDMKVFTNVPYKEVTQYVELPAERHEFKLEPAGQTTAKPSATNNEGLSAGGHYSLVAVRKDNGEFMLMALQDDLSAPSAGNAKVRVINAAVGVSKLDVVGPNGKVHTGVDSTSSTSYKEVPAKAGPLEVRNSKQVDVARISNVDLQLGKLYTFVVVGGGGRPIEILPVTDQLVPTTG